MASSSVRMTRRGLLRSVRRSLDERVGVRCKMEAWKRDGPGRIEYRLEGGDRQLRYQTQRFGRFWVLHELVHRHGIVVYTTWSPLGIAAGGRRQLPDCRPHGPWRVRTTWPRRWCELPGRLCESLHPTGRRGGRRLPRALPTGERSRKAVTPPPRLGGAPSPCARSGQSPPAATSRCGSTRPTVRRRSRCRRHFEQAGGPCGGHQAQPGAGSNPTCPFGKRA